MAKKLFLVDLDLNGNKLHNVAIEALSEAPIDKLSVGRVYFDSTSNTIKVYNGSTWDIFLKVGQAIESVLVDGTPVVDGSHQALIYTINGNYDANNNKLATQSDIAGVISAMHFIAVLDSYTYSTFSDALAAYKSEHPSYVESSGDIMIYGVKEYIYDGSNWKELGDETIVVTSFAGTTGAITVRGSQSTSGSINLYMSGNELRAELVMPTAADILMTGYSKAQSESAIENTDTVNQALGKVEYKVDALKEAVLENEETAAQALNELNERFDTDVVKSVGGSVGDITVRGSQSTPGSVNLGMSGNELQANLVMPIGSDIALTGYAKAQVESDVTPLDNTNQAIGKVEYKVDNLKQEILNNEETVAQALNKLKLRIDSIVVPGKYVGTISSDDGTHAVTITAAIHGCGTDPLTCVYYGGSQVIFDKSINASGDVTIAWDANTTVDAQNPVKVVIIG